MIMEKTKETYEQVIAKVMAYIQERFSRTDRTLKYYKRNWGRVKSYMDSQNISDIDASVCRDYLLYEFNNRDFSELTKREKEGVSTVNILIEFLETGAIQIKKEQINLDGPIGTLMRKYLVFKTDQRLNIKSINFYECHLSRFLHFLKKNNIEAITAVSLLHILHYIKSISPRTRTVARTSIQVLRGFFRYLYTQQILETDFSFMIPRSNYKSQPKIPSIYSKEEVEELIASVDRGHKEVVDHDKNGYLYEQNNHSQFLNYILKIKNNPENRNDLSRQAIIKASKFELKNSLKEMTKIYSKFLNN